MIFVHYIFFILIYCLIYAALRRFPAVAVHQTLAKDLWDLTPYSVTSYLHFMYMYNFMYVWSLLCINLVFKMFRKYIKKIRRDLVNYLNNDLVFMK